MTSKTTIDYEALSQDAMRGVVRAVLQKVIEHGLPGDHHFFISFDTRHPSVTLSNRLMEKYADEMTIVLQHRFWDLKVRDADFEVKLTFDGKPERLVIPFAAIKVFFDPSVRFGLQFEDPEGTGPTLEEAMSSFQDDVRDQNIDPEPTQLPRTTRSSSPRKRPTLVDDSVDEIDRIAFEDDQPSAPSASETGVAERLAEVRPAFKKSSRKSGSDDAAPEPDATPSPKTAKAAKPAKAADDPASEGGAKIVSLDAFRKK